MDKLKYVKLENPDGSYSESIPLSVSAGHVDITSGTGASNLANYISINDANVSNLKIQTLNLDSKINNNTSAISSLASGSPKGTYATTAALVNANPETGVYIITNNGHIYSWTKNDSTPIDLGVYQAASFETLYSNDSSGALTNGTIYKKEEQLLEKMYGLKEIPVTERGFKYNISSLETVEDLERLKEANSSWEYSKYILTGGEDLFISSYSTEYSARYFFILDENNNVIAKPEKMNAPKNKNTFFKHIKVPMSGRLLIINNKWTEMPNPLNYIGDYKDNREYFDSEIKKVFEGYSLEPSARLESGLCIELTDEDDGIGKTLSFVRSYHSFGSSLIKDVVPGDYYYCDLRYYTASNKKLGVCIYFVDDNYKIIGKSQRDGNAGSLINRIVQIPAGTTKVVLNSEYNNSKPPFFSKINFDSNIYSVLKISREIEKNKLLINLLQQGYSLIENPTIALDTEAISLNNWSGTWNVGETYTYTVHISKTIGRDYSGLRYTVEGGETIAFLAYGGSAVRHYAILDNDNKILEVASANIKGITIIHVPLNARSILFNIQERTMSIFSKYPFEIYQIEDTKKSLKDYRVDMIENHNIKIGPYEIGEEIPLIPEYVNDYYYIILENINSNTDAFYIKGAGGSNPRLWACLDNNNRLLSKAEAGISYEGKIPLAAGTSKIIINFQGDSYATGYIYDKDYELTNEYMKVEIKQVQDKLPMDTYNNTTANNLSEEDIYSYIRGLRLSSELQNHLTDFKKAGDKMVHVSTFAIIDDIVYMTYYVNTRNSGETPSEHTARFVYCSLNDLENKTYIDLQDVGETYDGKTVTALYDTILLRKDDKTLYLMWTAALNNVYYRLYRTYDITTGTLGPVMTNQFKLNNEIGDFCSSEMNTMFANQNISHKSFSGDIGIMQKLTSRIENDITYYYTGCYIGPFNCIIKSSDLVTWEFVAQPDFANNSQWENAVYVKNNKVYYFVRQYTNSNTGFLTYYDLNSKTWAKPVFIFDSQSRADFFEYEGNLYMLHAPRNRNHIAILKINTSNLNNSFDVEIAKVPDYFYPYCQIYNNELYMSFTQSRQHIWLSKFTIGTPSSNIIDNKFKEIFEIE